MSPCSIVDASLNVGVEVAGCSLISTLPTHGFVHSFSIRMPSLRKTMTLHAMEGRSVVVKTRCTATYSYDPLDEFSCPFIRHDISALSSSDWHFL